MSATEQLESEGYIVQQHTVDVSDQTSVQRLASAAANSARVEAVVHTAGLSPVMSSPEKIFQVDFLGTAIVIDTFVGALAPGGTMVCIASMAGHSCHGKLSSDAEEHLATAPIHELLSNPVTTLAEQGPVYAYCLAKRGCQLRVQAAAKNYGSRGCRINSVSPGVIVTPMAKQELDGSSGQIMRGLVEDSATARYGTPTDIAAAVAFLVGPESSFITGADLLVDGGSTASQRWDGRK